MKKTLLIIIIFILTMVSNIQAQSINKPNVKYEQIELYNLVLDSAIKQSWNENGPYEYFDKSLEAVILLDIDKDGITKAITFEQRSGNKKFDTLVIKTVSNANPLPPLPRKYENYKVGLIFTPYGLK